MQSFGIALSAWREILARIFEGFERQENASPKWLVNPATKRRLKLDIYYPEAGFAVRFVGITAKGQGRQSDWEQQESEQREQTRAELCRQNQVQLLLVEPLEDPVKLMDTLARLLLRAFRAADQRDLPETERQYWLRRIDGARKRAGDLRSLIQKQPEQMLNNLAAGGRDREAGLLESIAKESVTQERITTADAAASASDARAKPAAGLLLQFEEGMRVAHERFGEGVITACVPQLPTKQPPTNADATNADATNADAANKDAANAEAVTDMQITILFDGDQERTFLASLVHDKLRVLA